jgi:hypothetical protein
LRTGYYSPSGTFDVAWGSSRYASLASWQKARGEETLSGVPTGLTVDPKLVNARGGGTIGNPDLLATLTAYTLQPTTTLLDVGLDLSRFGITMGPHDYFGVPVPSGAGPEVGASELP